MSDQYGARGVTSLALSYGDVLCVYVLLADALRDLQPPESATAERLTDRLGRILNEFEHYMRVVSTQPDYVQLIIDQNGEDL